MGKYEAFAARVSGVTSGELVRFSRMVRVSRAKLLKMILDAPRGQPCNFLADIVGEVLSVEKIDFSSDEEREAVLKRFFQNLRCYEPSSLIELHNFIMKHVRSAKAFDRSRLIVNHHPIYSTDLVGEWKHLVDYNADRTFALMVPENESEYSENGTEQGVCLANLSYADGVRSGNMIVVNILDVDLDKIIGSILYQVSSSGGLDVIESAYRNNRAGGLRKAMPGLTETITDYIDGVIIEFLSPSR
jgi:hypothetical protein